MTRRTLSILGAATLAAALGCTRKAEPPADAPATAAEAAPATAAEPAPAEPTAPADAPLPPSDRVFTAPLDGKTPHLLGALGDELWAARLTAPDRAVELWRVKGPGVAQRVTHGDLGDGPRLYVAWGVGRGHLDAPLTVQALDPATGAATTLYTTNGERNEAAHLAIADPDRDGAPELDLVRYTSKYMVAPQPIERDGTTQTGPETRMASSWLRAEMDGKRGDETIIGRVYGDARGEPGDLRIITDTTTHMVPTDNGVKALLHATVGGEATALYFADGWVANYGKEAKAQLKRVRIVDGKPEVETLGGDPQDFTFFDLTAIDLDGDGLNEIVAQGGKRVTAFTYADEQWTTRQLTDIEPVINTAVDRVGDKAVLFLPSQPATKAIILQ